MPQPRRVDANGLQGRAVRSQGRGGDHHHQPARGAQRLPHPHGGRADRRLWPRLGRQDRRGSHPDGRRRQGLLLRGRPEGAQGGRVRRGHVLHVVCDITIASTTARFGQTGPRVGSVDPGYGTAYLARIVGEKKAREIWYFCRQYTAEEAERMGLVNAVVPPDQLMQTAMAWARELLDKSPTALKLAKYSFNADTAQIGGLGRMAFAAVDLYYQTPEAMEGRNAFVEKRPVNFPHIRGQ